MAKKAKSVFVCQECGYESPKWMGQCICGAWNTFVEEKVVTDKHAKSLNPAHEKGIKAKACPIKEIKADGSEDRIDTGIREFNRVLGGGLVKGSLTLISGEPGIGKSTVIMQAADNISKSGKKVLYVSGEESQLQLKMRADRICKDISDNFLVISETNIENIMEVAENVKAEMLIVDSIQTTYSGTLDSAPGSVSQVRACGSELMYFGKSKNVPILIVAHVTKSGELAGPKIVEHLVDCVLHFNGERNHELRILRSFKNRFGTTSEIGAFEMGPAGLIEIENLSKTFLEGAEDDKVGACITAVYEGTRPLLLEVQALTAKTNGGFARRTSIGIDNTRVSMILAVLERARGLSFMNQDIYVNVVGGLKPEGTYTDLGVAMAIYSSYRDIPVSKGTIILGEIGLSGEVRNIQNADKIIKEAQRMGFTKIVLPYGNLAKIQSIKEDGIEFKGVKNIRDAIESCFQ